MSEEMVNETGSEEVSSATEQTHTSDFNFKELISEDLRGDPSLADIKNVNDLAKGYVHAQKMVGSRDLNSIRIPSSDAGEEAISEFYKKLEAIPGVVRLPNPEDKASLDSFYNKLGRPETVDGYGIKLPDGLTDPSGAVNKFAEVAHQAGLTPDQVGKVFNFYTNDLLQAQIAEFNNAKEAGQKVLKEKWGADYNARLHGAKLMASKYAQSHPEAATQLFEGPLGNNPMVIEMLSDLAAGMSEADIVQGQSKVQYGMTAEEAKDRIQDIRNNKSHAYNNQTDPGHRAAVEYVNELYGKAYPGE